MKANKRKIQQERQEEHCYGPVE